MDAFFTVEEVALRRRVRDHLRNGPGPGVPAGDGASDPRRLLRELGFASLDAAGPVAAAHVVEEISRFSPRLGRSLLAAPEGAGQPDGTARAAAETAWSLGAAAAAYETCLAAARKEGFFASTLMDHQRVQVALAVLLSDLESARVRTLRALRLIERGESGRGEGELERASALAARARDKAAALAAVLGGAPGTMGKPEDERSPR